MLGSLCHGTQRLLDNLSYLILPPPWSECVGLPSAEDMIPSFLPSAAACAVLNVGNPAH